MKKIIYIGILSLLLLSCADDKLNLVPLASINEELVLKTQSDLDNAINGTYIYMYSRGGQSGYGSEFTIDTEAMTDNLIYSPQGRQTNLDGYRWTNTPNNTTFDYLESAYRPAELATKIILNINNIPATVARDNVEGQARFVRALCMFDMARVYSKIPTQSADANNSLGIYYLESIEPNARPSRPTVSETYGKIINDLLLAKDLIASNNPDGKASKSAVYALLSRVYLYMGDYQKVLDYGNLAISNITVPAMGTINSTQANVTALWNDGNSNGVLFKLKVDALDGVALGTVFFQGSPSARKSEFVVTKEFYSLFTPLTPGQTDYRKLAYTATSNFSGKAYNHIIKYDGGTSTIANVVDIKVIRIEEVYLNMAEAQYRLTGGGLANLDVIRSKRYSSFVSGGETGLALLDAILKERRLEFAFEMDRFFTLKRLGLDMNRSATEGHFADGTGVPSTVVNVPPSSYKWQLPIPQYYRDLNPNYQQNPGY